MKVIGRIVRWTLFLLIVTEIVLHFYNPWLPIEIKKTSAPQPHYKYELTNVSVPGLDKEIHHEKNSMGFRGKDKSDTFSLRIFCMGNGTTECRYLSDGKDWPSIFGSKLKEIDPKVWINNAGFDGQNSLGNLKLLKKFIIRQPLPTHIILMAGLEDMGFNKVAKKEKDESDFITKAWHFLELPKLIGIVLTEKNSELTNEQDAPQYLDLSKAETLVMNDSQTLNRIAIEQPLITSYETRLQAFADLCKANKIKLILVSQAILFADEKDPVTNINLANIKTGNINGKTKALLMRRYNKATFEIAQKNNLKFFNLSATLPKDSRYFYDGYNYTNEGSEMVAEKIFYALKDFVKK